MLKDNQLSTVLILVALGFLIYYLTKPSKTESSDKSNIPEPVIGPSVNNQSNEVPKPVIEEQKRTGPDEVINRPSVMPPNTETFNNVVEKFDGYDPQNNGADLTMSFELQNINQEDASKVDMNKNNVNEYKLEDLLPNPNSKLENGFDTSFSQAEENIKNGNLINVNQFSLGVDTVASTLKIASYDIRGTVLIPKYSVAPWNMSSVEPDINVKSLC